MPTVMGGCFGGLTGGIAVVRPAGTQRSDRLRRHEAATNFGDYDIWRKVSYPYVIPEEINTAALKTEFEQNCKARNILLSGISRSDYDRVAHLRTAHEIWNALSNFHQGTNNIKELRRDLFKKEYIKFEMKPGEALDDYLVRFNKMLSDIRSVDSSYDTNYPQSEISRHFLNGLDISIWEMKVTSIQESVNITTLTLDSLYTKLKTHEMNVLSRKVDYKLSALLGRGKREDKDDEKNNNNKPKGSYQERKLENLRKAFQQVCAAFEPLSDVDGESGDDDKGMNISDVCFMARGESDTEYEDNELKQPHDVLVCSTCDLNKMKLKDALGRVEYMEDVVKNNEVLSCPKCRKSKGVMVDCENCANLEKEVSYLKNSLLRFSNGKKNLNMILDQSKLINRKRRERLLLQNQSGKNRVFPRGNRSDRSGSRDQTGDRSDRLLSTGQTGGTKAVRPKASKTESIIFGDASTSVVLATGLVKVHFKKTRSKVFDSCGDSVLNISRYGRVFKADFENLVSPVITCLVAKFDKDVMFWHRRLGHVGFDHLTRLSGLDLVRCLPKLKKDLDLVCTPCHHAKMVASSHAPIVSVMTDAPGQLLHMDTVGTAKVQSVGGKWYVLVIVDDFLDILGFSLWQLRTKLLNTFVVQGEDGRIFEDESDDNDDDEVGSSSHTGRQAGQTAGTPPVRPAHEEWSDRPGSSAEGSVDAVRDGPLEITTSTTTDTERGSTSEVAALLHIQRRHPPEQIIGNIELLYGLKQALRAWYDRLKNFLFAKGFTMGKVDKTFFVLKHGDNQLFVQIYVDDIIFGCSTHALVVDFAETMRREFEMSMTGELSYFLGLQIKQTPQGTFVHQTKYTKDLLRRFKMENCKPISTPIGSTAVLDPDEDASPRASHRQAVKRIMRYLNHTLEFGIWYSTSSSICLSGYSDADFGSCRIDRKSTSGTCHFLGTSLIAWSSRKQSSVAQSTAESEYVAAASCYSQILWLLSTLKDYGLTFEKVPLFCDNTSAINIAKNPVQHSRTKHIDIRFHFLRDHVEKGDVELQFLDTKLQIADIFSKPLDSNRFAFLSGELGIIHPFGMV
uniref:Retrotransposon protein, putative, unclassified n=1 Tax=Oryza sativa subsp. japonica TaxID=39947 RepID=Q10JS8_ORYSJ|nr:retrotransposon protein, putative, unclassified [Oryza sativa Japonica Group]